MEFITEKIKDWCTNNLGKIIVYFNGFSFLGKETGWKKMKRKQNLISWLILQTDLFSCEREKRERDWLYGMVMVWCVRTSSSGEAKEDFYVNFRICDEIDGRGDWTFPFSISSCILSWDMLKRNKNSHKYNISGKINLFYFFMKNSNGLTLNYFWNLY